MIKLTRGDKKFCDRLLTDLVNIRSVSGEEREIIKYLENFFSRKGFRVKKIPGGARRSNLIVSLGNGPAQLCLNAHADTVPPTGNSLPKAAILKGRLYGLGSSDDKGPLVSAICAFKNLAKNEKSFKGRIDLFVSIGEERGGEGTEMAIKNGYRCKAAIVCESTGLDIARAQSGVYFMEIVTEGKACHGSKPWEGKNAILEMMALIDEIKKVIHKRKRFYLTGPASLNLGAINGGDIPNRVPDNCCAKLDIRLMPGDDVNSFKNEIKKIFKEKRWLDASYSFLQDREPMVLRRRDPLIRAMSYSVCKVLGRRPACLGIRGWTEAGNFTRLLNVPAIIFGPGGMEVAHSQNEHIELDEIYAAAKIYEIFIKSYIQHLDIAQHL